jgi:CheY-like chemotaxis protein
MELNKLHKKSILIVDDDSASLLLLNEIFKEFKYIILSSVDGESAVKLLTEQPVDLVLLDIRLPDISGFTVLNEIKKKFNNQIKVIAQTANILEDNMHYLNVGFDDYIYKPYNIEDLIEKIEKALKQ